MDEGGGGAKGMVLWVSGALVALELFKKVIRSFWECLGARVYIQVV